MEVSKKRKQWPWIAVQGNWKRSIWASQLRQVSSQFHHPSTLYLCRASSFLAMPSDCQPFSVFTFCNYENGNKTDTRDNASIVASQLFRKIAYGILSSQDSTLPKSLVSALVSSCPPGKIHDVLRSILSLYNENDELTILSNYKLNNSWTQLAGLMSSDISKANESQVAANTQKNIDTILNDQ